LPEEYDIVIRVIRKARLRGREDLVDIAISNGRIVKIEDHTKEHGVHETDAKGSLVTESYVNPHLHVCKV